MGYELLLWYDIHVTHTKFLDKLRNLLVILNIPQTESGFRNIIKDMSDLPKVLRLEGPHTLKALSIYQDFCIEICNFLPWINFEFETIYVSKSLFQSIIIIGETCSHGVDKYLRSGFSQRHQCQYLLKKMI